MINSSSPITLLALPGRILEMLKNGGLEHIDDLTDRIENDPDSILTIGGIGPKTLLTIQEALNSYLSESGDGNQVPLQPGDADLKSVDEADKIPEEKDKKDLPVIERDEDVIYNPPVQSLGDQFKTVKGKRKSPAKKADLKKDSEDVEYNLPVQSLADQFELRDTADQPSSDKEEKQKKVSKKKDKKGKKDKKNEKARSSKKDKKDRKKGKKSKKNKKAGSKKSGKKKKKK